MVAALTLSASTRFITGSGFAWFIELPPVLVSWLVFPLLGPLLKKGQHIQVDFLTPLLSNKSKKNFKFKCKFNSTYIGMHFF
jgi:TRAP-type C4-dicarboxylate transport system permease small subunit